MYVAGPPEILAELILHVGGIIVGRTIRRMPATRREVWIMIDHSTVPLRCCPSLGTSAAGRRADLLRDDSVGPLHERHEDLRASELGAPIRQIRLRDPSRP